MVEKCKKGYKRVSGQCKKVSAIAKYRSKNSLNIILNVFVFVALIIFVWGMINVPDLKVLFLVLSILSSAGLLLVNYKHLSQKIPKPVRRVIYMIMFSILINIFVMIGYQTFAWSAIVLTVIGVISIMVLYSRNYQYEDYIGIDKDLVKDSFIGVGFTTLIIAFSAILPLIGAIGIPYLPESIADNLSRFAIICISTPIIEEAFFRVVGIHFLRNSLRMPFWVSAFIISILFSVFHLLAYGGSYSGASGSFITAFFAGLIFAGLSKYSNSNIANMFSHYGFNFWIFLQVIGVIG